MAARIPTPGRTRRLLRGGVLFHLARTPYSLSGGSDGGRTSQETALVLDCGPGGSLPSWRRAWEHRPLHIQDPADWPTFNSIYPYQES